jgi:hypothetical protein
LKAATSSSMSPRTFNDFFASVNPPPARSTTKSTSRLTPAVDEGAASNDIGRDEGVSLLPWRRVWRGRGGVTALSPGRGGLVAFFEAAHPRATLSSTLHAPHWWLSVPSPCAVFTGNTPGATSEVPCTLHAGLLLKQLS